MPPPETTSRDIVDPAPAQMTWWLLAAGVASLFPAATLPIVPGLKAISLFDLAFGALVARAIWVRAFRILDAPLVACLVAFCASLAISFVLNPSGLGRRWCLSLFYSAVVCGVLSHLRVSVSDAQRTFRQTAVTALGIAWVVFLAENLGGIEMAHNASFALPQGFRRLGGFLGGNAFAVFLAVLVPFLEPARLRFIALVSSLATTSRSMVGIGLGALVAVHRLRKTRSLVGERIVASGLVIVGLTAYFFALYLPQATTQGASTLSLRPGGYLTVHAAAFRIWLKAPLFGIGPQRFPRRFAEVVVPEELETLAIPKNGRPVREPHSAHLGLLAECGLMGLGTFALLMTLVFRRLARADDEDFRVKSQAAVLGLLIAGHWVDWLVLKGLWLLTGLAIAAARAPRRAV